MAVRVGTRATIKNENSFLESPTLRAGNSTGFLADKPGAFVKDLLCTPNQLQFFLSHFEFIFKSGLLFTPNLLKKRLKEISM
ncbi:MAG: hypothetical protein A2169_15090 [Deltaproteobacteria bacterium RBG_13_47_9]|nr:MAG: hypothetical protein A2169_15090 [Deltaproteobacteria bacterium RBG_13_47_9]